MSEEPYDVYFNVISEKGTGPFPKRSDKLDHTSIGALSAEQGGDINDGMYVDGLPGVFNCFQTLKDVFDNLGSLSNTVKNPVELYPTYKVEYTINGEDVANPYKCWSCETAEDMLKRHNIPVERNEVVYIEGGEGDVTRSFWELFPNKTEISIATLSNQ